MLRKSIIILFLFLVTIAFISCNSGSSGSTSTSAPVSGSDMEGSYSYTGGALYVSVTKSPGGHNCESVGDSITWDIEQFTGTMLVLNMRGDGDEDVDIWTRNAGPPGNITGVWTLEGGGVITFSENGTWTGENMCSGSVVVADETLIGTWKVDSDDDVYLTYFEGGQYEIRYQGEVVEKGTYTVHADHEIEYYAVSSTGVRFCFGCEDGATGYSYYFIYGDTLDLNDGWVTLTKLY